MNEIEQRFVVKYFHLKGWGNKRITAELESTFQGSALSRATVKRWIRKFKSGDLSCHDEPRAGRPLTILGPVLKTFLDKHPFASARAMSRHFNISSPTVKEILHRELGLKKYTRTWVPHELSEAEKKGRVDQSRSVLDMLQLYARHNVEAITTGNESWFLYSTHTNSMFAVSAAEVVPRTKQNISTRKTMVTIFFTYTRSLVLNFLTKGTRFNQDYFIDAALPNLYREKTRIVRHNGRPGFAGHMDNSTLHQNKTSQLMNTSEAPLFRTINMIDSQEKPMNMRQMNHRVVAASFPNPSNGPLFDHEKHK
jgi:transposase